MVNSLQELTIEETPLACKIVADNSSHSSRNRIASQASILSVGSSRLRPDQESDDFLKRFAVNSEEIKHDSELRYHRVCFGM